MAHLPEKILVIVFALALPALVVWKTWPQQKVLGVKIDYANEIFFWQTQIKMHPDYRDGYLKLAEVYKKIGNIDEAKLQILLALEIDPNLVLPLQLADLR